MIFFGVTPYVALALCNTSLFNHTTPLHGVLILEMHALMVAKLYILLTVHLVMILGK